jgi:hypothetical protein
MYESPKRSKGQILAVRNKSWHPDRHAHQDAQDASGIHPTIPRANTTNWSALRFDQPNASHNTPLQRLKHRGAAGRPRSAAVRRHPDRQSRTFKASGFRSRMPGFARIVARMCETCVWVRVGRVLRVMAAPRSDQPKASHNTPLQRLNRRGAAGRPRGAQIRRNPTTPRGMNNSAQDEPGWA